MRKAVEKMPHETRGVFINKLKQVIAAQMHERPTWSSEMSMQMLLAI